ncbi:hypothetical protein PRIPAC_76137 [Pristionchus pacificus]|uniref:Uncharacterized protein n=1 Tax=Pristionchus pacificus TaxID=54126 RepID=A0A2A6BS47_PRIPA|nr:hypothetical protein PRIPAC_76137 [Pristionchus pacificus]|eukprot:PDM68581.1 hypothetical protein PRIPAC_44083 [Pristionchus pacificus]
MYKVSTSAVPRTTLPCINKHIFYRTDHVEKKNHFMSKPVKPQDISAISLVDLRLNTMGRRKVALTPPSSPSTPSTPSSAEFEQQMSLLDKSWKAFALTETGEPDPSIEKYKSKRSAPSDFRPVDIDNFLAERILREVDIDPKQVLA